MAAANLDLLVEQGATFTRTLTLKDSAGAPIDITGWTFAGQIRKKYDSSSPLVSFTCAIVGAATNGQFSITLSHTQTSALPVLPAQDNSRSPTLYSYDIECVKSDSTKARLLQGLVKVSPEVTK